LYAFLQVDTFRAYDKDGDNIISRKEYMQFIEESWKAAFRLLSEDVESKNYGVKIKDIESWNASKISVLNEQSSKIFSSITGGGDVLMFPLRRLTTNPSEASSSAGR
jgi:hypothetical protein